MDSLSVLTLLQIPKFKRKALEKILNYYVDIPTSALLLIDFLTKLNNTDNSVYVPSYETIQKAIFNAKKIIIQCHSFGISIVNYSENIFPQKLKTIPYPPLLLYYKGNIKYLNQQYCAAVIGTRLPSKFAELISRKLGIVFALKSFCVVSGLALGCDTYGHLGSLEKYGKNIAILPCGLNNIYPVENFGLANKIIASGGCLISEYPPNTSAKPQYFILRDRLQSGLASIVTIIETNITGGTMHTAKFALDQGKILVCVSPNLLGGVNVSNEGNVYLIENKMAISLTNLEDLGKIIKQILSNSLNPIYKAKKNEQLKYEQLKFDL